MQNQLSNNSHFQVLGWAPSARLLSKGVRFTPQNYINRPVRDERFQLPVLHAASWEAFRDLHSSEITTNKVEWGYETEFLKSIQLVQDYPGVFFGLILGMSPWGHGVENQDVP